MIDSAEKIAPAVLIVNPGGYAFARRLDDEGSIFIPPGRLGDALDGDEVDVRYVAAEKGPEGEVVRIRSRRRTRVVGVLANAGNRRWVLEAEDPRLLRAVVARGGPAGARPGKVVVGRIVDYPGSAGNDIGVAIERELGDPGTLDVEVLKILVEAGIDETFSEAVRAEADAVPSRVNAGDLENRADLRHLPFMTIDPPDARDFDDAVCASFLGDDPELADMRIHVAVADVSHYVRVGTAIDDEARIRCFSTYLPDRAIPMLPEQLSAHLCSLVPDADRLAMVVALTVDPAGAVRDVEVMAAVIHSRRRMSYDEVAAELAAAKRAALPAEVGERIACLRRAADRLRAARLRRGAIELNLAETRIVLDEDDRTRIRDVVRSRASREMTRAYNLIEELMLAANEAVGKLAVDHRLPIVFRVHDKPDAEKLTQLATAAASLGIRVDPERLGQPRGVQKFLAKIAGRERAEGLNMLMLRALAQADYRTQNVGHFALASDAYSHFTSPIRRYPDLVTHRVLKAWLHRQGRSCGPAPVPAMPALHDSDADAARSSARERVVQQAERDTKALFAALFMLDRVGDRFEGRITGMSASGVFVQLDAPFVDGMIRLASFDRALGEPFEREDSGVALVGRRSGRRVMLGDRLVVDVEAASIQRRQVDFALVALVSPARTRAS